MPVSMGWALLLLTLIPLCARADVLATLNDARAHGCGPRAPLTASARLDRVARLLSEGSRLGTAQEQAGYTSAQIVSLQLQGVSDERSLEQALRRRVCSQVKDPSLRELGTYRHGTDVWIVLGQPFLAPEPRDRETISARVLALTNKARSRPQRCGGRWFPAAPPLVLDARLDQAARGHSQDMAAHGYMAHTALDGSTPGRRVSRTGYRWSVVGENLASGMGTADAAVAGWLKSPEHCKNVMDGEFRHMGIAFSVNLRSPGRVYWTQLLATPRS
jgi:uncharacterized protein YkwD